MDANTWNSYHIISNRARSICYATRQQQFRMKTEFTVNQLANQAENQMNLMNNLQVRQPFIWSLDHVKYWGRIKARNESYCRVFRLVDLSHRSLTNRSKHAVFLNLSV